MTIEELLKVKQQEEKKYESVLEIFNSLIKRSTDNVTYLCRGETKRNEECMPNIARGGLDESVLANGETHLIAQFRQRASNHLSGNELIMSKTVWGTQLLMQHYRAPTRLIDWTYSPFVALYFACRSDFENDGYLYMYGIDGIRQFCNDASKTNSIPERFEAPRLDPYFRAERLYDWNVLVNGIEKGRAKKFSEEPWLTFCQPSRTTHRVIAQQSVVTFGNPIKLDHRAWLEGHTNDEQIWKYNIDAEQKEKIMIVLDRMNISASTLFPDLDGAGQATMGKIEAGITTIAPVDDW